MNQAEARVIDVVISVVAEMPGKGIDQGAGIVSMAGMNHKAGGFVDDQDRIILIDNI